MRTEFILLFLCVSNLAFTQPTDKQLRDTIAYAVEKIGALENSLYTYSAYPLNYDDCNLEILQQPIQDTTKWNIFSFWLADLDKSEMKVLQQPSGEWGLILQTKKQWKIKYDTQKDSGRKNHVVLFARDRQALIDIGKSIYFGINTCMQQHRTSDE